MKLNALTVLVTRPAHQANDLVQQLQALGAEVIALPALEIVPSKDDSALDNAVRRLEQFDTVVLTSVNGVRALLGRMQALSIPVASLASRQLAVIGPATGQALTEAVRTPDVMPAEFVSEALADTLGDVSGQRILLCRADLARPELADILRSRGAGVEQVAAYRIVPVTGKASLPNKAPDFITLTSSAGVRATLEALQANGRGHWMTESRLICIGPITAKTVRDLGFTPAAVAEKYTIPGLVAALLVAANKETAHAG